LDCTKCLISKERFQKSLFFLSIINISRNNSDYQMNVETNIQSIAVGKSNGYGNYTGGNTTNNNNTTNIDAASLDDFIGATANTQGYRGLVPSPLAGD
jgi:hypothetical protein